MPSTTFRIAAVRGIDVHVAPSWLLVAAVLVWGYQRSFVGAGRPLAIAVAMAVAVAVLFTASVLLHEVAHALEARHRGIEVGGITLFLLGGATALQAPDRTARDEFAVAGVGPWSNIVLAAVFGLLAAYADSFVGQLWGLGPVAEVCGLLGWLNLGLAAFNLIPGAPLDGGRVLRALIWVVTGDRHRSTVATAWFGILLGLGLTGLALWFVGWRNAVWGAIWIGLIGAYVLRSARGELARGRLSLWLTGYAAADIAPPVAAPGHADPALRDASDAAPSDLPEVAADEPADALVGLLDRDHPLVRITDGDDSWVSSLHAIDARISELRGRGLPGPEVPA